VFSKPLSVCKSKRHPLGMSFTFCGAGDGMLLRLRYAIFAYAHIRTKVLARNTSKKIATQKGSDIFWSW